LSEIVSRFDAGPEPRGPGLVQVFTGDGKGKTTAALGAAMRALGQGRRVYIVFFLKGDYPYGERKILARLDNVDVESFGSLNFVDPANPKPEDRREAERALAAAWRVVESGKWDMVILDEVNVAVAFGLIPLADVLRLVREKPSPVELILTGRRASPELVKLADLVTECLNVKHPYDRGVKSAVGREY
jgi:cob(I)alamin adenosyltransferase